MAKKYWLKLSEHFFNEDEVIFLESQQNGEKYIMMWVKLLLKCLRADSEQCGFMRFNDKIPYTDELLSKILRMDIDTVRVGMKYFQKLGMLEILDDGTLYVESVQKLIGKESDSAERVRKHRERKMLLSNDCNVSGNDNTNTNTNINKEVEEESKHINKYLSENMEIIEYWNSKKIQVHSDKTIEMKFKKKHADLIEAYEKDTVKKAIDNYAAILKGKDYFYSYKYSLWEFLTRKIDQFIDSAEPFSKYKSWDKKEDDFEIPALKD